MISAKLNISFRSVTTSSTLAPCGSLTHAAFFLMCNISSCDWFGTIHISKKDSKILTYHLARCVQAHATLHRLHDGGSNV